MVIRSQILIARSRHLDKRDKVTDINRRDWSTRLRLQQIPEFLGRDTGFAQDRPERATFEIPIMVGNGNQHARFFRMPEVVVAAPDVVHRKTSSLQRANELAWSNNGEAIHSCSMATATVSLMMLPRGSGSSGGIGRPSLVRLSR